MGRRASLCAAFVARAARDTVPLAARGAWGVEEYRLRHPTTRAGRRGVGMAGCGMSCDPFGRTGRGMSICIIASHAVYRLGTGTEGAVGAHIPVRYTRMVAWAAPSHLCGLR